MKPTLSIVIPIHNMKGGAKFLWDSINALTEQTFQDFEIIITKAGKMAENTNAGIKKAKGELIKILYLDDKLASPTSLQRIVDEFKNNIDWLITGVDTNPEPQITFDIRNGNNKLGSPSALTFRNRFAHNLLFDENMSWLLDCDYYHRLGERGDILRILPGVHIIMGQGDHQMTRILKDEEKLAEYNYINKKYE